MKKITVASFDTFNPRQYLQEYYTHVGNENNNLLEFFAKQYAKVKNNVEIIEFGGGPTIYQLITAAKKAKLIHFADYLHGNLDEIKKWKKKSADAFDWVIFFKKALELEGVETHTENIKRREALLRRKITKFLYCNAFNEKPLINTHREYDVVSVGFVAESITSSKDKWKEAIRNICLLVKKNGLLLMTALKEASYWKAGNSLFPAVSINEDDIEDLLNEMKFVYIDLKSIPAEVVNERSDSYEGYKGMMFVSARKNTT